MAELDDLEKLEQPPIRKINKLKARKEIVLTHFRKASRQLEDILRLKQHDAI